MIIYVAFYDEGLVLRDEHWMDNTECDARQRFDMMCAESIADGWSVIASPVTRFGEIPS